MKRRIDRLDLVDERCEMELPRGDLARERAVARDARFRVTARCGIEHAQHVLGRQIARSGGVAAMSSGPLIVPDTPSV